MPKDDLFDNVKLPKERPETPQAAPAPMREAAPAAAQPRAGVPASRLLGWAVPLLVVVAAIVLWSISVWLLLIAAGAAVVGLVLAAVIRGWQRRRTGTASRPGSTGLFPSTGGRPGSSRTGRVFGGTGRGPGRGFGSPGRFGSGRGPGGLFKGGSGRIGRSRSGLGQAAASGGRTGKGRSGRGGRFGSLLGSGRKGSASRTGWAGSSSGTGGPKRAGRVSASKRSGSTGTPKGGTGLRGGKWSTSRANPSTWVGQRRRAAQAVRAAVKTEKAKKTKDRKARKADPDTKNTGNKTTKNTGSGKRTWWKTWRAKSYTKGGEPIDSSKKDEDKPKPKARKATAETSKGKQAGQAKGASPTEDKTNQAKPQATRTDQKLKGPADAKAHVMSTSGRKPKDRPALDDYFDERELTAPPPKPQPRPLNVDDGGFISPVVTKPKVKATKNNQKRNDMTDRTPNPYVSMIDNSTKETFRQSTTAAAAAARRDADARDEKASQLRAEAAAWQEKEVLGADEDLLAEAARLEADATIRRAAAAAYDEYAN